MNEQTQQAGEQAPLQLTAYNLDGFPVDPEARERLDHAANLIAKDPSDHMVALIWEEKDAPQVAFFAWHTDNVEGPLRRSRNGRDTIVEGTVVVAIAKAHKVVKTVALILEEDVMVMDVAVSLTSSTPFRGWRMSNQSSPPRSRSRT